MNTIFYYIGVLVCVLNLLLIIGFACYYTCRFWKRYIRPSLLNLKFYMFGEKNFKGRYYKLWLERHSGRYSLQRYWHSMKYFKRLAYKRFISEAWKERKEYGE